MEIRQEHLDQGHKYKLVNCIIQGGRKLSRDGYAETKNPGALAYIFANIFGGAKKNFCWGREYTILRGTFLLHFYVVIFLTTSDYSVKWPATLLPSPNCQN